MGEGLGVVALCGLVVVLTVARCLRRVGYCAVASSGGPEVDGDVTREHHARLAYPEEEVSFPGPVCVCARDGVR